MTLSVKDGGRMQLVPHSYQDIPLKLLPETKKDGNDGKKR
jgi:hypothetical protein